MSTKLKNKITGEVVIAQYPMAEAYYPWEIISDSRAEVALKRALKSLIKISSKEISERQEPTPDISVPATNLN